MIGGINGCEMIVASEEGRVLLIIKNCIDLLYML